jgi:integrase
MIERAEEISPASVGLTIGWHVFRHTYRSLLDETGVPIGVQQKLMRHSNVATTMKLYGNASLRAKQKANSKVVQIAMPQLKPQLEPQAEAV